MKTSYNERSWAIDLISEINLIVSKRRVNIRKAGGERTLKSTGKGSSLFPDVLLFQDDQNLKIIQGWELKMPDTPITDLELLSNAQEKAERLGLNSFLVWNVNEASLYILEGSTYVSKLSWSLSSHIKRQEVDSNQREWKDLLVVILDDLEQFFSTGEIKSQDILDSLSDNKFIDVILNNTGIVKQNIEAQSARDAHFNAEIDEWWESTKLEYSSEPNQFAAISKLILVTWVNRFLFTHYLKKFVSKAREVDDFSDTTTVAEATSYFTELTQENDFLNVYAKVLGEEFIDSTSWQQILQLSSLLSELHLENIDQRLLQKFFEQLLLVSKRKSAGQYATPYGLASYLSRIVMLDKTRSMMDCFCGTGTILRASYDTKIEFGITPSDTIGSVWGSDKYSFPLQMSTLSLAKPDIIGHVINIFKSDVKDLQVGKRYEFIDPNTGDIVEKPLPALDYIISNLPFVAASKIALANPEIFNIKSKIRGLLNDEHFDISSKSDLLAYLPYYLWYLLKDDGRLGLIVSNSWLGTDWGVQFRETLSKFFEIVTVVTSAKGKWFSNADVVTNLIILNKRAVVVPDPADEETTSFISLKVSVGELENPDVVKNITKQTLLQKEGEITIQSLSKIRMTEFSRYGIGWSAFFVNLSWFDSVKGKLVKASDLFEINRGERRGWDQMFFPQQGHGIEEEYLRPVLKNLRSVSTLIAEPDGLAFCCSKTLVELQQEGATGALAWIARFSNGVNEKGKSLQESLARSNHFWYEMKDETVADLVATINYGNTLSIAKMKERSFVNQRLIRLTAKNQQVDIDFCHAIMNSFLGLFYIEAMGFGRGLGALDLSSTKMKENFFILDPSAITQDQIQKIKEAFLPLTTREIDYVSEEIKKEDRLVFEAELAEAYGLTSVWDEIKQSLLELYNIRISVED